MTMLDYLKLLRRSWLLVAALVLVGLALAALATRSQPQVYVTSGSVVVAAPSQADADAFALASGLATQRAGLYAALVDSDVVIAPVAQRLGETADSLRASVSASAREGAPLIDISATANDPQQAAARVTAVSQQLVTSATQVDSAGSGLLALQVVTEAEVPAAPISPHPLNNLLIGGLVGLCLGVAAVIGANAASTRVRTASDLPADRRIVTVTSLPVRRSRGILLGPRTDLRLEAYRHLRTNLQFSKSTGKQIAVAGTTSDCDAAAVAQQLANVMGEIGLRVVLLDASLRPPRRAERSNQPPASVPGVADLLGGSAHLDDVLQRGSTEGVDVIPAGMVKEWSSHLVSTSAMAQLLDELAARYDFVIVAAPPVLEQSESVVASALCGSSLLVVESGTTRRPQVLSALELLEGAGLTSVSVAVDHVTLRGEVTLRREHGPAGAQRA